WSGFSIHSQALSFISTTDINGKLYVISKFLHGIFASFYSIILYKLKYNSIIKPSFLPLIPIPEPLYLLKWPTLLISSFKLAMAIPIYMLLLSLILLIIYYLLPQE